MVYLDVSIRENTVDGFKALVVLLATGLNGAIDLCFDVLAKEDVEAAIFFDDIDGIWFKTVRYRVLTWILSVAQRHCRHGKELFGRTRWEERG